MTATSKTRAVALAASISLALTGCSVFGQLSEESKLSISIAAELHDKPMPGFTFSDISEPDSALAQGFEGGATADSSFNAIPDSSLTRAEQCDAVIEWASANLTDIAMSSQYNASASGLDHANAACRLIPSNWFPGFSLGGLYKGVVVQVVPQGSVMLINIDGTGATMPDIASPEDPNAAATTALLDSINAVRKGESRYLTDKEMQSVWDGFTIPVKKMTVNWKAADDGTVQQIHVGFTKNGLLPFCLDIGPWNTELVGADPGSGYQLLLVESFAGARNLGSAVSGDCAYR